jgi:hypothetical protein
MSKEFIFLEPIKTWIVVDENTKTAKTLQCCVCNAYCNHQSFKATYLLGGIGSEISKIEYYCRKDAMNAFPYYFNKKEMK